VTTEDFTLNFDNHEQLLNFIENRDFDFKTMFPHLRHYISRDEDAMLKNLKDLKLKSKQLRLSLPDPVYYSDTKTIKKYQPCIIIEARLQREKEDWEFTTMVKDLFYHKESLRK
jgi:hypothetical protein